MCPLKHPLLCAVYQVPKGSYGADVAAHGCIHLGRSAYNRPCHWIPDNGRLDSTYSEILYYYYYNRCYLSCCSNNNTLYHKRRPSFHVWNMVSLRYQKEPDLRACQHITGKKSVNRLVYSFVRTLLCVTGIQTRHSE